MVIGVQYVVDGVASATPANRANEAVLISSTLKVVMSVASSPYLSDGRVSVTLPPRSLSHLPDNVNSGYANAPISGRSSPSISVSGETRIPMSLSCTLKKT